MSLAWHVARLFHPFEIGVVADVRDGGQDFGEVAPARTRGFPGVRPGATAMRAGTFLERPHQRVADTSNRQISHSIMLLMQVDRIDFLRSPKMEENGLDPSSSHFGRRRSVNVIAGLDPAIGSGTGSAKMPLNRMAIAGTDPRNKSEDDEKAFGPAKTRTADGPDPGLRGRCRCSYDRSRTPARRLVRDRRKQ